MLAAPLAPSQRLLLVESLAEAVSERHGGEERRAAAQLAALGLGPAAEAALRALCAAGGVTCVGAVRCLAALGMLGGEEPAPSLCDVGLLFHRLAGPEARTPPRLGAAQLAAFLAAYASDLGAAGAPPLARRLAALGPPQDLDPGPPPAAAALRGAVDAVCELPALLALQARPHLLDDVYAAAGGPEAGARGVRRVLRDGGLAPALFAPRAVEEVVDCVAPPGGGGRLERPVFELALLTAGQEALKGSGGSVEDRVALFLDLLSASVDAAQVDRIVAPGEGLEPGQTAEPRGAVAGGPTG